MSQTVKPTHSFYMTRIGRGSIRVLKHPILLLKTYVVVPLRDRNIHDTCLSTSAVSSKLKTMFRPKRLASPNRTEYSFYFPDPTHLLSDSHIRYDYDTDERVLQLHIPGTIAIDLEAYSVDEIAEDCSEASFYDAASHYWPERWPLLAVGRLWWRWCRLENFT